MLMSSGVPSGEDSSAAELSFATGCSDCEGGLVLEGADLLSGGSGLLPDGLVGAVVEELLSPSDAVPVVPAGGPSAFIDAELGAFEREAAGSIVGADEGDASDELEFGATPSDLARPAVAADGLDAAGVEVASGAVG